MRALIFDFDGLILDTETPEVTAWEEEFARWGVAFPDGWWQSLIGRGADMVEEWPEDLLERLVEGVPREEVLARVNEHRLQRIHAQSIQPGVTELLDLADARGWKLGVASSSKHDWVDTHLARLGLFDRFEAIVCRGDTPRAKPYPDLYIECCRQLDVKPADALALEDSPNGIAAAKAAGMACFCVPNSVTRPLDLSQADRVFESLVHVAAAL